MSCGALLALTSPWDALRHLLGMHGDPLTSWFHAIVCDPSGWKSVMTLISRSHVKPTRAYHRYSGNCINTTMSSR